MPKSWTSWGAVVCVVAAVLAGCGSPTGAGGSEDRSLAIGAQLDNNSFDPAELENGNRVAFWQPVYDTLVHLSPDGVPEPGLATGWSYNADNTVLTLDLRAGVVFTDGTPFDAAAVKANIEHLRAGSGQNQVMVADVAEVAVLAPERVELRLAAPVPSMLVYLGQVAGAMASPRAIEAGTLATAPVGSGPYVLAADRTVPGTRYVYTRNPDYRDPAAYPYDEVSVLPMADITPRLNALRTGQIDAALLSPATAAEAEGSGVRLHTRPFNFLGLILADRDGTVVPELADPRVRQAINLALDREGVLRAVLQGYGAVTNQIFNVDSEAYDPALDTFYGYDPERARALLAEAGVGPFTLTMPQNTGAYYNALYPILADQLAAIGITVQWQQVPPDRIIAEALSGRYGAFLLPLGSSSPWQDVQTKLTTRGAFNVLDTATPELDALISGAQRASGAEQAAQLREINRYVVENAWFAPLARVDTVLGTTAGTDVTLQAFNTVPDLRSYRPAGR